MYIYVYTYVYTYIYICIRWTCKLVTCPPETQHGFRGRRNTGVFPRPLNPLWLTGQRPTSWYLCPQPALVPTQSYHQPLHTTPANHTHPRTTTLPTSNQKTSSAHKPPHIPPQHPSRPPTPNQTNTSINQTASKVPKNSQILSNPPFLIKLHNTH